MNILCRIGVHAWAERATHRPGTSVFRCRRCQQRVILHRGKQPVANHWFWVVTAGVASLFLWAVIYNVISTGHTKILKTTGTIVDKVNKEGSRARRAIHRAQGDKGSYVEGY